MDKIFLLGRRYMDTIFLLGRRSMVLLSLDSDLLHIILPLWLCVILSLGRHWYGTVPAAVTSLRGVPDEI